MLCLSKVYKEISDRKWGNEMEFIAATNNTHKLEEMRRILKKMGHTLRSQKEVGLQIEVQEDADTFEGNAMIKAGAIAKACQCPVIADDSGLCVSSLNEAPGVHSARYSGVHGDDVANNQKLLTELKDYTDPRERAAKFVSVVCVALPTGIVKTWRGECTGTIADDLIGDNGFGYDPLFIPDEIGTEQGIVKQNAEKKTYAQLTGTEKDAVSHRGRALKLLEEELAVFLESQTE